LGNTNIPTDPWGRILIPFRGPPYTIPYISAVDVFKGVVPKEAIQNKLVFIGSSATAVGDLAATSIAPIFAGIEIHAQTASGILDDYLPYKPAWGKGASIGLILVLGLILALTLPFLGPLVSTLVTFAIILLLLALDHHFWKKYGLDMSVIYPIFSLLVIYVLNEVFGYIFGSRRRKEMKSVFGQYVPPECIDSMLQKSGDFGLEGETKDLSVLFADIRGFTTISEGMSATDLKVFLNSYLGHMTEIIFEMKGTIDKYVGDMIMAFWGAPVNDPQHPEHAVLTAFEMQKRLDTVNQEFHKDNLPEIRIGIGINSGTMNVGDMGSKFRRAYTVLGDAVNLGSRLESITKYYHVKILVGENTYEKTKHLIVYRQIDRVKVKGKLTGINIYEPIGVKGAIGNEILSNLEIHKRALDAYTQKRWDEAETLFKQLKEVELNKELYDLYLSRISEYKVNPPPEDWDGTYTLDSK
jgi:adenylate cyclase